MKCKIFNKIYLFTLLLFASIVSFANTPGNTIVLENNIIKAEFDKKYGTLVSLKYKNTGWVFQNRPELAKSFKMYVPTEDRRDNSIKGELHELKSYKLVDNKLFLNWTNLNSTVVENLKIEFTGIIEITDEGLVFTASVSNKSNLSIEAIHWPYIGDFYLSNKKESTNWLNFNYDGGMIKTPISPDFNSSKGYWGIDNPIQIHSTQYSHFGLLQTQNQGIYFGYHDTTDLIKLDFTFELKPGFEYSNSSWMYGGKVPEDDTIDGQIAHYEFYVTHFPYVKSDETSTLFPVVLNPYEGDWHRGADYYKKWRTTWTNNLPLPTWASEVHSWRQIQINSAEDRPLFTYKQLTDYCDECVEYNVKAIQLTGWTKGGQDSHNPSHDTDPLLGTYYELKDAINECKKKGVNIILFNKYTWADQSQDWFKNELVKYAIKDPYGNYPVYHGYQYQTPMQLADINTRRLIPMCPLSKDWRRIAVKEFSKSIELGASGMLYDENQHHGGAFYCFDQNHNHKVPANVFYGDKLLEDDFWSVIREKNPDYLLCGESNRDLQFQSYHMTYFRISSNFIPMHRYVAPKEKMQVVVGGHNDRRFINIALKNNFILSYEPKNFKGKLSEIPRTMDYGNKMDNLRRRYKAFLWDGVFMDTQGATVQKDNSIYSDYSVFVNQESGKMAIVMINNDLKESVTLTMANEKMFFYVSPENQNEKKFTGDITIAPLSSVVLIEQ